MAMGLLKQKCQFCFKHADGDEKHPFLNHDPLHLVEGDFIRPPVVELGGAG